MSDYDSDVTAAFSGGISPPAIHPDYDPDVHAAFAGAQGRSAPAVYDAAEFKRRVGRDPSPAELANFKQFKGVGFAGDQGTPNPSWSNFLGAPETLGKLGVGAGEDALSLATGIPASVAAAGGYFYGLTGAGGTDSLSAARAVRNALTYRPRTEAGQAGMEAIGQIKPGEIAPRLLDVAGYPNAAQTVREVEERGMDVAPFAGEAGAGFPVSRGLGKRVFSPMQDPESASADTKAAVADAYRSQNMGAASVAPDVSKLSVPVQAEIADIRRSGGQLNTTALERHAEAESLDIPVPLTRGQARGDSAMISDEFNAKGEHHEIGQRYDYQNQALKDNLDEFRREAAPGAVGNDPVQNSQVLIDHLKAYDEAKTAEIDKAYGDAREAFKQESGGQDLQMDGNQFVVKAGQNLKNGNKAKFLPSGARSVLDEVSEADGKLSFADWEANRTILANEVRKADRAGDGNAVAAIGAVRDALETTSPVGASATVKPLFDNARSLAKARFDEIKADPAYKAVTEDAAPMGEQSDLNKSFAAKYIIGGTRANLQRLRQKFQGNDEANETMTAVALNHLKQKAGVDMYTGAGNFSQSGYNRALADIEPRSRELLGPDLSEKARTLGNVARYTQAQSRGGYANNSHTLVGALAKSAGSELGNYAENAANTAVPGLKLGTRVAKAIGAHQDAQWVRESLKPGAGLRN